MNDLRMYDEFNILIWINEKKKENVPFVIPTIHVHTPHIEKFADIREEL